MAGKSAFVPVDTAALYARLIEQVNEAVDRGVEVPCLGPGAAVWTSDEPEDQELAADRCLACPLADQCRDYAFAAGERAGVWGGYAPDYRRRRRPRRSAKVGNCGGAYAYVSLESGAENPRSADRNGYPTTNAKPTPNPTCNCGCGAPIGPKAMYRPGHDARHVSSLIGYLQNDVADGKKITAREIARIAKQLPSAPLQAKFTRAAERFAGQVAAPAKPEPKAKADTEEVAE